MRSPQPFSVAVAIISGATAAADTPITSNGVTWPLAGGDHDTGVFVNGDRAKASERAVHNRPSAFLETMWSAHRTAAVP